MEALHGNRPISRVQERKWTASSAGRILRPFQSSLAALYKSGAASHNTGLPPADQTSTHLEDTRATGHLTNIFFTQWKAHATYRAKKTAVRDPRKRFTARCDQTPAKACVSLTLPTPFRHDSKNNVIATNEAGADTKATQSLQEAPMPPLPLLGNRAASGGIAASLDRTVIEKFQRLILATKPSQSKSISLDRPHEGPKSLLSLSLRQIPEYIEAEESLRRTEDPDDRSDVSLEMFEWLEDIEKLTFQSDRCLRETLRRQGIWLLREAIAEGLISAEMVKQTVNWCSANDEAEAAQEIADAFMGSNLARDMPTAVRHLDGKSYIDSKALDIIADFCPSSSRLSPFRLLCTALSAKSICLFVLPGEKAAMYTSQALRAVTSRSKHWMDALRLLQTILCEACGIDTLAGDKLPDRLNGTERPRTPSLTYPMPNDLTKFETQDVDLVAGVFEAVKEICVITVSMAYIAKVSPVRFKDGEEALCDLLVRALRDAALGSMRLYSTEGAIQSAANTGVAPAVCVVLLANLSITLLALDPVAGSITCAKSQEQHLGFIARFYEAHQGSAPLTAVQSQANFLRDLALKCEGLRKGKGFALLKQLTSLLLHRASSNSSTQGAVTKLSLEAALFFAQRTHDPTHMAYAGHLEQRVQEAIRRKTVKIPARCKHSSIRWDDGLCEWVAVTPRNRRRDCVIPQTRPRSTGEEKKINEHEQDQDPLCAKENKMARLRKPFACKAPSTGSNKRNPISVAARSPKNKRSFENHLTEDDESLDELALVAQRSLRDVTNIIRPQKQRRTL